jgi:hypothetical protein
MDGAFAPTSDRSRLLDAQDRADYHQPSEDRLEAGLPSQQNVQYPLYPSAASASGPAAISGQDAQRFVRPEAPPTYVVGMNTGSGADYGAPYAQVPIQHFGHTQQQQQPFVYGQV